MIHNELLQKLKSKTKLRIKVK